jgi:hypothetical protein
MLTSGEVLDHYFLDTRCMLLEIAATLDRYDAAAAREADGPTGADDRMEQLCQALQLLAARDATADRAERLLNLFSDNGD